jgi:hypothetical protein
MGEKKDMILGSSHIDDEWMFDMHEDFFLRLDVVHLLRS